jgi:hypothetical protein
MTPNEFRSLALSLPEAAESAHMGHPDFRVCGKVFASLLPEQAPLSPEFGGMVKLTPEQQASFIDAHPDSFRPANGAWGLRGYTVVRLCDIQEPTAREALTLAWRNTAPKRLAQAYPAA